MKKVAVFALAALLVPSVAFAKNHPNHPNKGTHTNQSSKAMVMYILKGTITQYSAGTSIEITVTHSNRHKWALNGADLTVSVSPGTKVVLRHGATAPTSGDRGIVKVKAPKSLGSAADLEAALPTLTAVQVIDQGVAGKSSSSHGKNSGTHGKAAPKVMYVLKGTITAYTAASGNTLGSVTIMVDRSNRHKWGLKGMSLTVPISSTTKIVLGNGATSVTVNDRGIVKEKAPKSIGSATDLVNYLTSTSPAPANAFQIIDQGVAAP